VIIPDTLPDDVQLGLIDFAAPPVRTVPNWKPDVADRCPHDCGHSRLACRRGLCARCRL